MTLLEYGDYQCTRSGHAYVDVSGVLSRMGEDVCFVFRHFPLFHEHPYALLAAQAAEAAGAQGMMWPMHALLFEHQPALDRDSLLTYATRLGLDVPRFARELDDEVHLEKVYDDYHAGVRAGVTETPAFFLNGARVERWDRDSLVVTIAAMTRPSRASFG